MSTTDICDRPLRSVLYLPASKTRAIEKARSLVADAVIFDLEDAVAPDSRFQARANLEQAFASGPVASGVNVIRINALLSDDFQADVETATRCRPDAILVPKVSDAAEVLRIRENIGYENSLWCMVESARGIQNVNEIAAARSKDGCAALSCLVVGTNDIVRETGVSAKEQRRYLESWLMASVLAAKSNGLRVLDGVWNDFKDEAGFDLEATQGKMMGFDGKTLIHPSQIAMANRIYSPSLDEVQEARAIEAAFSHPANVDKGVLNLNGRMVERLHLEMARALLRRFAGTQPCGDGA